MVDQKKNSKHFKLLKGYDEPSSETDRRSEPSNSLDIERRQGDRRQNIVGRGKFTQYLNLYNLIYNSKKTTPEIKELFDQIMPDEEWQVRFVQEVTLDRMFHKRKSLDDLRAFFLKNGVVEVHEQGEFDFAGKKSS